MLSGGISMTANTGAWKKPKMSSSWRRQGVSASIMSSARTTGNGLLRPLVPLVDVDIGAADAGPQHVNQDVVDADFGRGHVRQPQAWLAGAFDQSFHDSTIACHHRPLA